MRLFYPLIEIEQIIAGNMLRRELHDDVSAADKVIVIALVSLLTVSVISAIAYMSLDDEEDSSTQNQ